KGWNPIIQPPRGPRRKRGLFSTRSPHRPNPIALSALRITSVDLMQRTINVAALDLLDGTPVLDVKPYVPYADAFPDARAGWISELPADPAEERDYLPYDPPPPFLQ
ncbi:unnamed protein product, partial [Phaeothamnion confervicola]